MPSGRVRLLLATLAVGAVMAMAAGAADAQRYFREGGFATRLAPAHMPDSSFVICRLAYTQVRREASGIGWETDYPYAEINLSTRFSELTRARVSRQRSHPDALLARAKALDWRWYGLAVGVVGVCTGAAWLMFPYFSSSNLIMIYLLGVVAMAARATRGPTVLASVLSVAAFNFFFVPPRLSFGVSDTEHLLTFAIMLLVALVISGLTVRIRVQAETARSRERRIAALYGMSRELAGARDVDRLLDVLSG